MRTKVAAPLLLLSAVALGLALSRADNDPAISSAPVADAHSAAPPPAAQTVAPSQAPAATRPALDDAEARLELLLPEVRFDDATLASALAKLQEMSGANLVVQWRTLAAAGIEPDLKVKARLHHVRLATALRVVLDDATGENSNIKLGYSADGEIILVTTAEALERHHTVTRVYDIADFDRLLYGPIVADARAHELSQMDQVGAPPPASVSGPFTRSTGIPSRQEWVDMLIRTIEETMDPNSWRDAGGTTGAIREMNGLLMVTQTPENHRRIERYFSTIRSLAADRTAGKPPSSRGVEAFKSP